MDLLDKLAILADSAKYDVACTSSGSNRPGKPGGIGSAVSAGICHTFASDGRCVSLLKVLLGNACAYDCRYCANRRSADVPRAAFTPEELAELTISFYRRNYIEGLFLSSAVLRSPDYTMERMISVLSILRGQYRFNGYIHAKAIPGASPEAIRGLGMLADRMSVNIELPSESSLNLLAPDKSRASILRPMSLITRGTERSYLETKSLSLARTPPQAMPQRFAPAGQSTQMIIGATPETDRAIVRLASGLYHRYRLRRVFYSAYVPVSDDSALPAPNTPPPLLREHRLYQADFLMRFYGFDAEEILPEDSPSLNAYLDPKCSWALRNPERFPVDVNRAELSELLRVPGVGPKSAERIMTARRQTRLTIDDLRRLGVVLKRARYFIQTADTGRSPRISREDTVRALLDHNAGRFGFEQLSLFDTMDRGNRLPGAMDAPTLRDAVEEAVACLASAL
ncbi:MAG: putative DNA modification/repair radical SAM protein [Oscillospiraceae bacterium]|jgi:putative DNA modification/repair radical SAM protein|nr:putative DNA modification/repair radical SAM protein [Oscillospiraceae bacterium]